MRFLDWLRSQPARRARQVRRQAGLRRRPRVLGSSGLPAEAELWVMQIEDALRRMEPRIRGDLSGLSCLPALARGEPPARPTARQRCGRRPVRVKPPPRAGPRRAAGPARYPAGDADGARAGEEVPDGDGVAGELEVGGAVDRDGRELGEADDGAAEGERDGLDDDLAGLGDELAGRGVRDGEADGVWLGADVGLGFGVAAPADVVAGRTSRYRANTATNSPASTRVDVRGRPVTVRSRSSGRCRARPRR